MILLIDNYDSFTYNLAQFLGQLGGELEVRRNDQITLDQIAERIASTSGARTEAAKLEASNGHSALAGSAKAKLRSATHAASGAATARATSGVATKTAAKPASSAIERIVISPGPGVPENAGICVEVIRRFAGKVPILGVCLGHQAIGYAFGGRVIRAPAIMHGKTSRMHHDGKTIFRGLPQDFVATRYHSLIVERKSLPPGFEISAEADGLIMAMRNPELRLEGVQFHPESVLTEVGMQMLRNFLSL